MPLFPASPVTGSLSGPIVLAASKSQMDYAYRQCQHKFGYRFARVKIQGNRYICQFRDSNATVTKKALKRCANLGASLQRVTKIYIKGNRYIARMICLRRQQGI